MRLKIMITGCLLACGVALTFRLLQSQSTTDPGNPSATAERTNRSASRRPVLVTVDQSRSSGEAVAQPAEPAEPLQEPPPAPREPLRPEQENARLRKLMDDSGGSVGDALDRSSREIAGDLVTQLRSHKAAVALQAVDCRAAGCTATLEIDSQDEYFRLRDLFDGTSPGSPLARWPGARVVPPVVHRSDGKLVVSVMLIRPDSRVNLGS